MTMTTEAEAAAAPLLSTLKLTQNVYHLGLVTGESLHNIALTLNSPTFSKDNLTSIVESISQTLPRNFHEFSQLILSLFNQYKQWWLDLLKDDPVHVLIETVLLASLLYLFFYRKKEDWRKKMKDNLNNTEVEELLTEWKERGRHSLASGASSSTVHSNINSEEEEKKKKTDGKMHNLVVERMQGSKITLRLPPSSDDKSTTDAAKKNVITVSNFATHDYLGMSCPEPIKDPKTGKLLKDVVKEASKEALSKYGCGSCGPRGFYGTIDAHLHLEENFAKFTSTEQAILYSDGATTTASTVAAFAKRGDLLVVDEGIYEALGTGVTLSRANVKYFKHNDMEDLRRVLERVQATDKSLKRKINDQRRFIVVEALYKNYGNICPLKELVKLKEEFCYRLILDESFSFGAMGKTGKGALEHFGLRPMYDAEIVTISLENALGSIGGVTIGNEEVVDHQRLSGAGYCFSASTPPFLADAASASLKKLEEEPQLVDQLNGNIQYFYKKLFDDEQLSKVIPSKIAITSAHNISPIVIFQLTKPEGDGEKAMNREQQADTFDKIAEYCLDNGIFVISTGQHVYNHLHKIPPPALRMTIMNKQSKEEIDLAIRVLRDAFTKFT